MDSDKKLKLPKCPSCYAQPLPYGANLLPASGGLIVATVRCSTCGHVLSVQIAGQSDRQADGSDGRMYP